jgi:hypothetical protein
MTGVTSGAGTAYQQEHLGSTPVLVGFVVLDLLCVYFVDRRFLVCPHDRCHVWMRNCYHPGAPKFTPGA